MHPHSRPATQPLRVVATVLCVSVLFVAYFQYWLGLPDDKLWNPPILIACVTLMIALEWLEQRYFGERPPLRLATTALVIRVALIVLIGRYDPSGFNKFLHLIPPALAYLYIGRWASYGWGMLNFAAAWVDFVLCCGASWWLNENNLFDMLIIFIGIIFVVLMARTVVLQEKSQKQAEALVKELETSQLRIAELATVDERNRIARDIHDSVGHHLTAINIQLEKAIAFRPIDAKEADQALYDAKRAAQSALSDVRESVSQLRDPDQQFELSAALRQLVDSFGRIPTTLHIEGDESDYAKSTLIALYRAAQEGLTNIEKHACANSAELKVKLDPSQATLLLQDDGVGIDDQQLAEKTASNSGHFGLIGLQERLELVGGTLNLKRREPRGTLLRVVVPARGLG